MEIQATKHLKNREWSRALDIYNQLLKQPQSSEQKIIVYLLDRLECLHELGNHEQVINDCKQILKSANLRLETMENRIRFCLIRAMLSTNRHSGKYLMAK